MTTQKLKEWIVEKRKLEIKYCGRCYTTKEVHPYSLCKTCWEKTKKRKRL